MTGVQTCALPICTPNAEYNALYPSLSAGERRHQDHRFEWSRERFGRWASRVAGAFGYRVSLRAVGEEHPQLGAPTQLAVFVRQDAALQVTS